MVRKFKQLIRTCMEYSSKLFWTIVPKGNRSGVYRSFDEAVRHIPKHRRIGYDHPEAASLYAYSCVLRPSDYAVLFHLRPLVPEIRTVFDFGGNAGRSYFPFSKMLNFPAGFRWLICEVPAVVELARKLVAEAGENHIAFTTELQDLSGCDVLLASGMLQFIEEPLDSLLAGIPRKPPHVLINRTAVWQKETYVTLEHLDAIVSPYIVRNEKEFVQSMVNAGYELIDSWDCLESQSYVRRKPELTLDRYRGFYFRLPL